jgi:hypothetical protein
MNREAQGENFAVVSVFDLVSGGDVRPDLKFRVLTFGV